MHQFEPFGGSVTLPAPFKGRKLSLVDWDYYTKLRDYQDEIVAAYGFPNAEAK